MAAEVMARAGLSVTIYDSKPSPARKFLMAGKSGLNLTLTGDFDHVMSGYGDHAEVLRPALQAFDHAAVRDWASDLGIETFTGSTGRVFPTVMKASPLLRAWLARLGGLGVTLERRSVCTGLDGTRPMINGALVDSDVTVLACGGASWARLGSDGAWANWFGGPLIPFQPSNGAARVAWSALMERHFGKPVKNVTWSAGDVTSRGEAILTAKGLEGGGIYTLTPALRTGANVTVDLTPDRSVDEITKRLSSRAKKMTLARWLEKVLRLSPVKIAMLFEASGGVPKVQGAELAQLIKAVPIATTGLAPIDQAISTAGGVPFAALDDAFMVQQRPGVFCAGEMLDWDAPTGGWLLTACFATGAWAGAGAVRYVTDA